MANAKWECCTCQEYFEWAAVVWIKHGIKDVAFCVPCFRMVFKDVVPVLMGKLSLKG